MNGIMFFFVFLFTKFDAVGAFRDALLLLRTEMFDQFALWNAVREIEDETMKFAFHWFFFFWTFKSFGSPKWQDNYFAIYFLLLSIFFYLQSCWYFTVPVRNDKLSEAENQLYDGKALHRHSTKCSTAAINVPHRAAAAPAVMHNGCVMGQYWWWGECEGVRSLENRICFRQQVEILLPFSWYRKPFGDVLVLLRGFFQEIEKKKKDIRSADLYVERNFTLRI